jgi:hypothetical protein
MSDTKQNCESCRFFDIYVTGIDEYPQRTAITTCLKGHWENGDPDQNDYSYWNDCIDYEKQLKGDTDEKETLNPRQDS